MSGIASVSTASHSRCIDSRLSYSGDAATASRQLRRPAVPRQPALLPRPSDGAPGLPIARSRPTTTSRPSTSTRMVVGTKQKESTRVSTVPRDDVRAARLAASESLSSSWTTTDRSSADRQSRRPSSKQVNAELPGRMRPQPGSGRSSRSTATEDAPAPTTTTRSSTNGTTTQRPRTQTSATERSSRVSRAQMEEMLLMEALAVSLEDNGANEEQLMTHLLSFDSSQQAAASNPQQKAGVDKILLSMLPVTEFLGGSTDGSDECPLCIGEYEVGERMLRLPCLHSAHEECLSEWLDRNTQCPVCKLDVQESLAAMCEC